MWRITDAHALGLRLPLSWFTNVMALHVDAAQVAQFVREISLRPHSKPGDELLFSVLKPHEAQIRACHEHNFK